MLPALRVGGVHAARVMTLMADGRIRLLLGDALITARAEAQVREGESLTVEVLRLRPEVMLRVRGRSHSQVANS
ncbi:MAG: hypothetical protein JSV80_09560 [Acidobacteriota bacterium]|nr:MAG: hypothetical protein JSV80_09560 [Acidobacteriota bacterium]